MTTDIHITPEAPVAPGPPRGLTVGAGNGSVTASWQPPADLGGATSTLYVVKLDDVNGDTVGLAVTAPDATTYGSTHLPAGSYRISVSALTGAGESTFAGPVAATVQPQNRAPLAADDAFTTDNKTMLTVPAPGVLANDTDPDGDELTAALTGTPAHGTATATADGGFTYTSTTGFVGTDSFQYRTRDGRGGEAQAMVTITVTAAPSTAPQRLVFAASGQPATLLAGPLTAGGFEVTIGGLVRVDWIRGTAQLGTGAAKTTVSLTIDRVGLKWTGAAVISGSRGTHTFTGTGIALRVGRLTVGQFADSRKRPWGFAITDARR